MFNQRYPAPESKVRTRRSITEASPFDDLASDYDAWFERDGKLIFAIEVRAFQEVLPCLPKPWLEIGVGSGRFAQALGIEIGVDPSIKLLEMAKQRGITAFLGLRGAEGRTNLQKAIYEFVKNSGKVTTGEITKKFNLTESELQREERHNG